MAVLYLHLDGGLLESELAFHGVKFKNQNMTVTVSLSENLGGVGTQMQSQTQLAGGIF